MNTIRKDYVRPLDIKQGRVDLSHGSGGRVMAQLIEELFAKHLGNEYLAQGDDGARLPAAHGRLSKTTALTFALPLRFFDIPGYPALHHDGNSIQRTAGCETPLSGSVGGRGRKASVCPD